MKWTPGTLDSRLGGRFIFGSWPGAEPGHWARMRSKKNREDLQAQVAPWKPRSRPQAFLVEQAHVRSAFVTPLGCSQGTSSALCLRWHFASPRMSPVGSPLGPSELAWPPSGSALQAPHKQIQQRKERKKKDHGDGRSAECRVVNAVGPGPSGWAWEYNNTRTCPLSLGI